jgi:hypothetical protein
MLARERPDQTAELIVGRDLVDSAARGDVAPVT